jgi:hypothetical protein
VVEKVEECVGEFLVLGGASTFLNFLARPGDAHFGPAMVEFSDFHF